MIVKDLLIIPASAIHGSTYTGKRTQRSNRSKRSNYNDQSIKMNQSYKSQFTDPLRESWVDQQIRESYERSATRKSQLSRSRYNNNNNNNNNDDTQNIQSPSSVRMSQTQQSVTKPPTGKIQSRSVSPSQQGHPQVIMLQNAPINTNLPSMSYFSKTPSHIDESPRIQQPIDKPQTPTAVKTVAPNQVL
ncbi:MAG: hypothetical protein EZS28_024110 [Streblomastix strix]|uniref:Uncharacterized protein n=1 Tax=Streblomastix strix TaxID=222440 RepID=A0A5J4VD17_9EUKA|nr:MAG: hypothetical protein EZS28_024110 [Streblomastix strix]